MTDMAKNIERMVGSKEETALVFLLPTRLKADHRQQGEIAPPKIDNFDDATVEVSSRELKFWGAANITFSHSNVRKLAFLALKGTNSHRKL
jgi:hypothetical protein